MGILIPDQQSKAANLRQQAANAAKAAGRTTDPVEAATHADIAKRASQAAQSIEQQRQDVANKISGS